VTLLRPDHFSQRFLFARHRLARRLHFPVTLVPGILVAVEPNGVARKIQALAGFQLVHDAGFLPADLRPLPPLQLSLEPVPQRRTDIPGRDREVVRVARIAAARTNAKWGSPKGVE
jgi:hypothetical protein